MEKITNIFPANDFGIVAENASAEVEVGLVLGYSESGDLCVYGGGLLDGRQPTAKDWLWMVESFKANLLSGEYAET